MTEQKDLDDVAMRLRRHYRKRLALAPRPLRVDSALWLIELAIERLNGQAEIIDQLESMLRREHGYD